DSALDEAGAGPPLLRVERVVRVVAVGHHPQAPLDDAVDALLDHVSDRARMATARTSSGLPDRQHRDGRVGPCRLGRQVAAPAMRLERVGEEGPTARWADRRFVGAGEGRQVADLEESMRPCAELDDLAALGLFDLFVGATDATAADNEEHPRPLV